MAPGKPVVVQAERRMVTLHGVPEMTDRELRGMAYGPGPVVAVVLEDGREMLVSWADVVEVQS